MIVIADKPGQLGNMLLLFSHFIGRSIESDFPVSCLAFENYADCFPATETDLLCRFPAKTPHRNARPRLRRWLYHAANFSVRVIDKLGGNLGFARAITIYDWDAIFRLDDPAFVALARSGRLTLLRGWGFRDYDSLRKHADRIRDFFRPHEANEKRINELISRARENADVLIGVHIRHGIIHFDNTRKWFYSAKRYAELMAEVKELFPGRRVAFLICSDWVQDPKMYDAFNVTYGTGDLIEDMYAFAQCDYLMGAPSTFTMWASFYGKVPLNKIEHAGQRPALSDFVVFEALGTPE
ncbi:MAG TPA: alpha-1,2-fucosyltransferase [Pyrinomonadaceae bacterium]|nr:alpha-1,2-fucosyltransferase [Pyrinomonadaceae bacterium]